MNFFARLWSLFVSIFHGRQEIKYWTTLLVQADSFIEARTQWRDLQAVVDQDPDLYDLEHSHWGPLKGSESRTKGVSLIYVRHSRTYMIRDAAVMWFGSKLLNYVPWYEDQVDRVVRKVIEKAEG